MKGCAILVQTAKAGLCAALALAILCGPARAAEPPPFDLNEAAKFFPGATRFGPPEGNPASTAIYRGTALAGYVFSSREVTGSTGYSGKPLDLLIGLDTAGRITRVVVHEHHEPILVIGVSEASLTDFVSQYTGLDVRNPVYLSGTGPHGRDVPRVTSNEDKDGTAVTVDGISGASISSVVFNDAVLRSARIIARARGILPPAQRQGAAAEPALDLHGFEKKSWPELLREQAVAHLALSVEAVDAAFVAEGKTPWSRAGRSQELAAPKDASFIDLFTALATPARIGRNLLGDLAFNRAVSGLAPGDQLIVIAGNGLYSFKGTAFVRTGVFDRVEIVQDEKTIELEKARYTQIESLAAEAAPEFREAGLFVVPAATGFDPARPWRLEMLVSASGSAGGGEAGAPAPDIMTFALPYRLPENYFLPGPAAESAGVPATSEAGMPLWQEVWLAHPIKIAVLSLALVVLTITLIFQDQLEHYRQFYRIFRISFLTFTLLWIGWYAGAQLSVFNVITFVQAVMTGFHWEFFLLGPLMFILWTFVAITLIFWGRGVFCGWLCPFGALQELMSEVARKLGVPQIKIPFVLQERLWMIKYVVFLMLLGVSFYSVRLAVVGSEVEPFKTVMSLKFLREWPFVAYAAALLLAGVFIERFYCRYLCALGAALAIPARLRMFEWLKRRRACGSECHICAVRCTVGAIHPDGHINLNECIYCLNCQILYYDDHVCPPLIARRKRRELRAKLGNLQTQPEPGQDKSAG